KSKLPLFKAMINQTPRSNINKSAIEMLTGSQPRTLEDVTVQPSSTLAADVFLKQKTLQYADLKDTTDLARHQQVQQTAKHRSPAVILPIGSQVLIKKPKEHQSKFKPLWNGLYTIQKHDPETGNYALKLPRKSQKYH